MNCKEFKLWLRTRDIHDSLIPGPAVKHMANCSSCEQLFHFDNDLETKIQKGFCQEEVPKGLAEQISITLKKEKPRKPFKIFLAAGTAMAGLIILALTLFPFNPVSPPGFKNLNQITLQAVTDHLHGNRHMNFNAQQADQALEQLTKDLGFKVLLPNLADYGCILLGGRLCALGNCRAAYFVLDKQGQSGSLFIMDTHYLNFDMAEGTRFSTHLKGCEADVWKNNDQVYAMVF